MRTFAAYYALHSTSARPKLRERAAAFLPNGIIIEEAARLGRVKFFMKLTEMFAAEIKSNCHESRLATLRLSRNFILGRVTYCDLILCQTDNRGARDQGSSGAF